MPVLATGVVSAFTAFQASALGTFLTSNFFGRLLSSVALSALASALSGPASSGPQGMQIAFTSAGGTLPCSFVLGKAAIGGDLVCPPMSQGKAGSTPLAYLTQVISLGDVPGQALSRLMINGEYVEIGVTPLSDYGNPVLGKYLGYAWVKFYDGSQTVADPMLLDKFGTYAERPWTAGMVGRKTCYAIVTCLIKRDLFNGQPDLRFEMIGIPVYDPRKDSTVGGSGAHRWANTATWETSTNAIVLAYNVMRGITLPSLGTWGGGIEAEDLPVSNWFTAMNECDVAVALAAGGTEPAWRAGIEVTVDKTPATILGELLKAANAQVAEVGGIWKVRVGGPGLPVYFVTDDDFVVTRPQELDPAPGYDKRYNAIAGRYYEPEQLWQPKDAPAIYNTTWEAQDGGQRFLASVEYLAVWGTTQVQRLMTAAIAEERRFRRHQGVLPPDAAILEPLDALQWTSTRNGYASKSFEVSQITDDPVRLLQGVSFRERDSADYVWSSGQERGVTIPSPVAIDPQASAVPGWTMGAIELSDGVNARRPALRLAWTPDQGDAVTQLRYEIRLKEEGIAEDYATIAGSTASLILDSVAGIYAQDLYGWAAVPPGATFPSLILDTQYGRYGADETWASPQLSRIVLRGVISNLAAGEHFVADGVLNGTEYEGSAFPVMDGPVVRSAWVGARTPDVFITNLDFEGGIQQLFIGAGIAAPEIFTALPSTGNYNGRLVLLTTDYKLYRYTPSGWTTAVPITDVTGQALATDVLIANSITGGLIAAAGIITSTAQMGAATVETLTIAGNAVNVPVRANSPAVIDIGPSWTKLISATIKREGWPTDVEFSTILNGFNISTWTSNSFFVRLRIKRGGTVIWTAEILQTSSKDALLGTRINDLDVGTGNTVYSLEALENHDGLVASSTTLALTQMKR